MINSQSEATLFKDHEISPSMGDKNYLHRKKIFKEYNTGQGDLFPEDLTKSIGPTHIARFIKSAVDSVNLDEVISKYKGGGASAYASREC